MLYDDFFIDPLLPHDEFQIHHTCFLFFDDIPEQFILMKEMIKNETIRTLYSKFKYKYCHSECATGFFLDFLKEFKFIIYFIDNNQNRQKFDLIICAEGICFIILEVNYDIIDEIINDLKNNHISILNASNNNQFFKKTKEEEEFNTEINNFCLHTNFRFDIQTNKFVKLTIKALSGFLIRSYFYPTYFFTKNPLFECKKTNFSHEIQYEEFAESDFIFLRCVESRNKAFFKLVFHIKKFRIFMMKKIRNEIEFQHEIIFCKNYRHRSLTRFYGFVKEDGEIIGFIYEYLSNGSLASYIKNSNVNELNKLIIINRIFQGIMYLHSNFLIHRDIKPLNILLDRNFLPFVSDFDSILSLKNDTETDESSEFTMTNDIGSDLYVSPEQYYGNKVSYSTDIYSFGLVIYFIYEKHDLRSKYDFLDEFPQLTKASFGIQNMYKNCVHYLPSKRLTDEMIKVIISNEIDFFSSQEQFKITNYKEEELSQFIFEDMMIKQKCLRNYSFLNLLENEMKPNFLINSEIEQRIKSILLEYYELLSEWNDPTALNNLGYMYHYGNCVEQNYSKAIEYYELAASLGNSDSLTNLGLIYEQGPERDYSKAKEYYELSAKKNNAEAISYLGELYYNGTGVEKDYQKAKEYFEQSGELNCTYAFYYLFHIYRYGYGVEKNETKAREYELLAKYDFNSEDLIDLGNQYKYGDGVEKDYDKARKYFEMSAKLNNSEAYISLGSLYYHGYGVKKDNAKAKEYYEISTKMCNSGAMLKLGNLYFFEKNYVKAIEYYKLASKLNNPQAFTNLGYLYFSGHGVKQNYSKAKEYYEIAAQYNNKDALDKLGNLYEHGYGVTIDYLLARHYYERSAKLNYVISFIRLGKLYYNGIGVDKNYLKAFEYYQLSLKFKNPIPYYRIGYMYEKGLGVDQDYHKAKEYYELSAEFNHSDSLLRIGHLYRKGHGVKQNILVAKHFYQLSAKFNNSHSFFNLARMYSNNDILVDFTKAIKYFIKCSQIHNEMEIVKDSRDHYFRFHRYNKFCYRSYNDVGLIYLLIFDDIEKANEYIKQSAFGEYPFGQNNFGLLNEIYFNEKGNAEYMYTKSSKKHFALAEYNLAHYLENNDKVEESITYYIRASEDENLQLSFQNHRHNDKQLEISKKFIICLTNLKLTKFYFSNKNLNESKKYFIRTFAKFESSSYKFHFRFVNEKAKNPFLYLKAFIFNFPSFNLMNQPYLNLNIKEDIKNLFNLFFDDHNEVAKIRQKENNLKDSTDEEYSIKQKENNFNLDVDYSYFIQSIQKLKEHQLSIFDDYIFENTSQLFDFSMKKENLKSYLISEIIDIIHTMETILYTPPYSILFGRINQESKNKETIEIKNIILRDINELFYEGFGYDV